MHRAWLAARAQARFRGEVWELSIGEYFALWREHWDRRGLGYLELCMTRRDCTAPWSPTNVEVVERREVLRRNGERRRARVHT